MLQNVSDDLIDAVNVTNSPEDLVTMEHADMSGNIRRLMMYLKASTMLPFKIGQYLHEIYFPILVVLGLVGNVISFLVMVQPHNRSTSSCLYMACLAVSDSIFLLVGGGYYWYVYITKRNFSELECILDAFIVQVVSFSGVLVILAMTFDRYLAIRYPLKAALLCSVRRAKKTQVAITVTSIIFNTGHLFLTKKINGLCIVFGERGLAAEIYSWMNVFIVAFIPFILLLCMNSAIIYSIKRRSFKIRKRASVDGRRQADGQITAMLMAVSFTFIVLNLPYYIRHVMSSFYNFNTNAHTYAVYYLFYHITNKLYTTNSAINFFLYCVTGSRFRSDVVALFCRKAAPGQNPISTLSRSVK